MRFYIMILKNVLKDYLLVENEKQLAGQVATKYVLSELQHFYRITDEILKYITVKC